MNDDPRRAIVQVIARLGRETQLHLDERYRHFRITDGVTIVTSLLLLILAVFNVYYIRVLYQDFNGIVANMDSMYSHLVDVDDDMNIITEQVAGFDAHLAHMEPVHANMVNLSETMPAIRASMDAISKDMFGIEQSMGLIGEGMGIIDQRVYLMTGGVATMRQNVRQFARPIGSMSSFFP